jgi:aminoglycoside N3'-acetyltransferase
MEIFLSSDTRVLAKILPKKITLTNGLLDKFEMLNQLSQSILNKFGESILTIPIYNFDFTNLGRSKLRPTKITTGVFNKHFYEHHTNWQSSDPVFSICGTDSISLLPIFHRRQYTPYGKDSIFEHHIKNSTKYVSVGIGISEISTLMHYVETVNIHGPLYRYHKKFEGRHEVNGKNFFVSVFMHCRPKSIVLDYDVERLNSDLVDEGIMKHSDHLPFSFESYADQLFTYWNQRRNQDPFYFLTDSSRIAVENKLQKLGRAFLAEDFEDL